MSIAIYRKYRPKSFEGVLGQDQIVKILRNAVRLNKISHAYLFYGSRGTGKTTVARILAKAVNCESIHAKKKASENLDPCNECSFCEDIDKGQALDLIEIDAASNRGIEEIRNLQESVRAAPIRFPYKIFIIDEAHMLTKEAFNALLKTLEEPPAHTIFVLATTEIEKMPATITSRAQRFHFKKIGIGTIVKKLKEIIKKEGAGITDEALEIIGDAADGSFRDAESLLDQIVSFAGNSDRMIDEAIIEEIIGKSGFRRIIGFVDFLLKKDYGGAVAYIQSLYANGHNVVDFNKELIHYLGRLIAFSASPQIEAVLRDELTDSQLGTLKQQASSTDIAFFTGLLKSLIRAYSEMRYSPITLAPFMVALLENIK